ncbi:MAG: glycosyltransferase family 4 protein [Ginsengibacter sp.]
MRIAYISHEFPPDTGKGGIGTYVSQVAKAMAEQGDEVHVFAGSPNRDASEFLNGYYVHRVQCKNGNDFREKVVTIFATQNTIATFGIIESPEINGNAWEIKKIFPSIPLVVRLHAPDHLVESLKKTYLPFAAKLRFVLGSIRRFKFDLGYWRSYNKDTDSDYQFIQLANHISAPSQAMKDWTVKNWQIDPDKITIIPNIFSPSQDLLNIPFIEKAAYHRIVFFGRLNVLKGLVNATKAMKKILTKYPDWQFRVIGDDGPGPNNNISMRDWMKMQLAEVSDRVEFMDGMAYDNLPAAISDCEIVLLPSLFESFSYTCAEAMAAGKAVVGSNNAGMADLIKNEVSGLLVNPYSHEEITVALNKLILDNEFRYALSVQARKDILAKQNANDIALLYQRYYQSITQKDFAEN